MITAQDYYDRIQKAPPISSGDPTIDILIHGALYKVLSTFYMDHPHYYPDINENRGKCPARRVDGGGECQQVAYIDGENTFNPYYLSKYALSNKLPRIIFSIAFWWRVLSRGTRW